VTTVAEDTKCGNCGAGHAPDDIFCENCGYDFITGSLPRPDEEFPVSPPGGSVLGEASSTAQPQVLFTWRFEVGIDRAYFEEVVSQGELEFPAESQIPAYVELEASEVHIGRTSESRLVSPDLDIAALTGDPAVSSRHAVLKVTSDGSMALTDVGSTNGTFIGSVDSEAMAMGVPIQIPSGTTVYLGAWTYFVASLDIGQ